MSSALHTGGEPVLVVGAGIGGLALAVALRGDGRRVRLLERAPALERLGAGLLLWPNAVRALDRIGVGPAARAVGRAARRLEIRRADGALLSRVRAGPIEARCGAPVLALHRGDLQRLLVDALAGAELELGAECRTVRADAQQATALLADGSERSAPILVGADGLRSRVRESVHPGVMLRYAGYTAWRGVVRAPELAARTAVSESWGRGARFGIVPLAGDEIYWFATDELPPGATPEPEQRRRHLLERFRGWHAPVPKLLETTPAQAIVQTDLFDFAPVRGWSSGRAVLLGDAIHPTTPNLGQGAGMALESAVVLARRLAREKDVRAALRGYEHERRRRTAAVTRASWRLGRMAQARHPLAVRLRDGVVRLTPEVATRLQMLRFARPVV